MCMKKTSKDKGSSNAIYQCVKDMGFNDDDLILWILFPVWHLSSFLSCVIREESFIWFNSILVLVAIYLSMRFAWFLSKHCRSEHKGHEVTRQKRSLFTPSVVHDLRDGDDHSKP